ncbi:hypothetical protein [Abyssalbus ytuae]|uniref:Uncharacterized protein n=1 Tax=Abyssalbus ytuae TaxID=2926907 RepID=A0A9E7CZN9_9FLAO|nr:hypothetical protein [Abyssalbus ytuae]UOB17725.1 hypothetical protein MQE35_00155 [Abyssalbus ytuae]
MKKLASVKGLKVLNKHIQKSVLGQGISAAECETSCNQTSDCGNGGPFNLPGICRAGCCIYPF